MYVFLGGGLGSLFRYGIGIYFSSSENEFPMATFVANIIACLILGVLVGMQMKNNLNSSFALLLMTGFCGGFSTFSTFSNDTLKLFENQQFGLGILYVGGSVIVGLLAVYCGIKLYSTI